MPKVSYYRVRSYTNEKTSSSKPITHQYKNVRLFVLKQGAVKAFNEECKVISMLIKSRTNYFHISGRVVLELMEADEDGELSIIKEVLNNKEIQ